MVLGIHPYRGSHAGFDYVVCILVLLSKQKESFGISM